MRKKTWIAAAALLAAALLSYPWVINSCAFYPQRGLPASDHLPPGIQELSIPTADGERLACYWLPRAPQQKVMVYFHGNSGHIGHRLPHLVRLADMGVNVLGVGYRGFGNSTGHPSESGIYKDGAAVLNHLVAQRGFKKSQIVLVGVSIGSTVAVEIARGQPLGGVILVTPLTSGKAVARNGGYGLLALFAGDMFDNLSRVDQLRCPLLILHGTEDEVTPVEMARELYAKAPEPKRLVIIEGAHHNDITRFAPDLYWGAIDDFMAGLENPKRRNPP